MTLETLFFTCLIPDLVFSESGVRVSFQKQAKEVALFFSIDEQSNGKSTLREDLGIPFSESICDGLIYYSKEDVICFCLVELKGRNIEKAIEQIHNTYDHLNRSFSRNARGKGYYTEYSKIIWKAYIAVKSSSPCKKPNDKIKQLEAIFNKGNVKISHNFDIAGFIRQ